MSLLTTTNAATGLFVPSNETQLECSQTILMCLAFGAIMEGKVMTLRVEHFEPRSWALPLVPGEPLVSFAINRGRVAFRAHERTITVDGFSVLPNEYGYIDLDGVASRPRAKQISIDSGSIRRHIIVSPRHVQHDGQRTHNVWDLKLREERLSILGLTA